MEAWCVWKILITFRIRMQRPSWSGHEAPSDNCPVASIFEGEKFWSTIGGKPCSWYPFPPRTWRLLGSNQLLSSVGFSQPLAIGLDELGACNSYVILSNCVTELWKHLIVAWWQSQGYHYTHLDSNVWFGLIPGTDGRVTFNVLWSFLCNFTRAEMIHIHTFCKHMKHMIVYFLNFFLAEWWCML